MSMPDGCRSSGRATALYYSVSGLQLRVHT